MNLFEWIKNKKEIEKEMEHDDRIIDKQRTQIAKLTEENENLKASDSKNLDYLQTIKEQRKEINKMKKEIKFLTQRDNKLQNIEFAIANKKTYKEVKEIVKGE